MRAVVHVALVERGVVQTLEVALEASSLAAAETTVRALVQGCYQGQVFEVEARPEDRGFSFLGESMNSGNGVYRP